MVKQENGFLDNVKRNAYKSIREKNPGEQSKPVV